MRSRPLVALALAAECLCAAGRARAQPIDTGLGADRFVPALGPGAFLGLDGAGAPAAVSLAASLSLAGRLVTVVNRFTGEPVARPLERAVVLDVAGEMALGRRLSVGMGIPVALSLAGDRLTSLGDARPLSASAAGDLRLRARLLLYGLHGGPFRLSAGLLGTVPGGGERDFIATSGPTLEPRLVADYDLRTRRIGLRLGALAGFRFAPERRFLDATFDSDLHLGLAVDGHLPRPGLLGALHALAELEAGPLDGWLEARAGLRLVLAPFAVEAGGGAGLLSAPGNPSWRAFVTLRADR